MPFQPILGTLGYVFSPDGKQVLLIHRNARSDDPHFGKYNGLGGKMEPGEDVVTCMRREIREEANIECDSLQLCGTISWPGFGKNGEDWFGFLFRINAWTGTPLNKNAEGTLEWVDVDRVSSLPLWEGDHHFLPLIFGADSKPFHGVMPYDNGRPKSWAYTVLE
ncbi:MAG: NUDIX domain-containing protein [Gemmataceae bacterium]